MLTYPDNAIRYDGQTQSTIEADKLCELIKSTIIERYSGKLEKRHYPRGKVGRRYLPLDTDQIRQLLNTLWGDFVAEQIRCRNRGATEVVRVYAQGLLQTRHPANVRRHLRPVSRKHAQQLGKLKGKRTGLLLTLCRR